MSGKSVLILGAHSDSALAIAHKFAKENFSIQLAGRRIKELESIKTDLELRYNVAVSISEIDILEPAIISKFINQLPVLPYIVISLIGLLGNQLDDEKSIENATKIYRTNFEGPANLISIFANEFERRGYGIIVGVCSVAGERGRRQNYIYGSSKAGLITFLSGLRNRLAKKGIQIVTVIPGYMNTKMTENMKLPKMLTAQPQDLANAVFRAIRYKKDVIYVLKIWKIIMFIIKHLPENLFKRINF